MTHNNGTWKVGSKVTLASGDEFLTHGGTDQSGPVTRYRLVFTPNAGFTLPDTLPGDGFKVGTSAVFHVYLPAPGCGSTSTPITGPARTASFTGSAGHITANGVGDVERTETITGQLVDTDRRRCQRPTSPSTPLRTRASTFKTSPTCAMNDTTVHRRPSNYRTLPSRVPDPRRHRPVCPGDPLPPRVHPERRVHPARHPAR